MCSLVFGLYARIDPAIHASCDRKVLGPADADLVVRGGGFAADSSGWGVDGPSRRRSRHRTPCDDVLLCWCGLATWRFPGSVGNRTVSTTTAALFRVLLAAAAAFLLCSLQILTCRELVLILVLVSFLFFFFLVEVNLFRSILLLLLVSSRRYYSRHHDHDLRCSLVLEEDTISEI